MPPTTEQEALVACLVRRSEKLARIYSSGLSVFYQKENPGRLELAAHAMRELMDKSSILTGREAAPQGDGMKTRIRPVKEAYLILRKAQGFNETFPLDAVEGAVRRVLDTLDKFFEWVEANRPEAKKRTAQMLSELSGPGQALPVDIADDEVARWMVADGYFKKVAHNGQDHVNENAFIAHMTFVESVLLQRLQPQAIADLDVLDALVREAENG